MKVRLILASALILCISVLAASQLWRGETLSAEEVGKRWGKVEFDQNQFKNGSESLKASMAFSILKSEEKFKGKDVVKIREELGSPNGFYFSDIFPAYLIQIGKSKNDETWQIVFLLDQDRKVSNVIVHKSCCD